MPADPSDFDDDVPTNPGVARRKGGRREELLARKMGDLRELGAALGVKARTKRDLVDRILAAETALEPTLGDHDLDETEDSGHPGISPAEPEPELPGVVTDIEDEDEEDVEDAPTEDSVIVAMEDPPDEGPSGLTLPEFLTPPPPPERLEPTPGPYTTEDPITVVDTDSADLPTEVASGSPEAPVISEAIFVPIERESAWVSYVLLAAALVASGAILFAITSSPRVDLILAAAESGAIIDCGWLD